MRLGTVAVVGVIIGVASLINGSWNLQKGYIGKVQNLEVNVKLYELKITKLEDKIEQLRDEIIALKKSREVKKM